VAEVPNAALGCDRIQADIVRLRIDRSGALTLEGETDQARAAPAMPGAPEGERPIVEAAAHSEAPALAIDADKRRHDQMDDNEKRTQTKRSRATGRDRLSNSLSRRRGLSNSAHWTDKICRRCSQDSSRRGYCRGRRFDGRSCPARHGEDEIGFDAADVALVRNAGSVFVGDYSPQAAGDYASGPNHVLPTGGAARFRSGLSVLDFVKLISVQRLSRAGLKSIAPVVVSLADAEGLRAHADSIRTRVAHA